MGHYHLVVSRKGKFIVAILGAILLLVLIAWKPWSVLLYHGDGQFSDELFFYPRYWVRFADVPLSKPGEYHFRSWGLPNEEMSLILYIKGSQDISPQRRDSLENFPATIEAQLTDGKGNIACHALGRPADGEKDGVWVLMSGAGEAGYWHYQCNPARVSSFRTYSLMIRVSDVGPGAEKLVVTPTLNGGGTELP